MVKEDDFSVPNDDILGGIKAAIERGHNLKEAMVTLYNAGYSKEEIEEAARKYMMGKTEDNLYRKPVKKKEKNVEVEKEEEVSKEEVHEGDISRSAGHKPDLAAKKKINEEEHKNKQFVKSKQKVSNYDEVSKKKRKMEPTTMILIALLILLIGVLVTVFLFKAELVDFFNRLFG